VSRLAALGRFAWDFVVGDDWRIAVAVIAGLLVTDAAADLNIAAWWILPVAVAALLAASVRRAAG
jgi:hypothetical protein